MKHGDYIVDLLDPQGKIVGQKRRSDVDKKRDIYHAVHVLMVTPAAEVVLSRIPERQDFPNIFARRLGTTVATLRRHKEEAEAAARRALQNELFMSEPKVKLLGESMVNLSEGYHALMSAYWVMGEPPARFSTADIESLSVMSIAQFEDMLSESPERFAATLRAVWGLYGKQIQD